ncbi:MAG: hypothetical protein ABI467_19235 [Kofleriaceae bacterium]
MSVSKLSREIRRLLETELDSFEKLEVMSRVRGPDAALAVDDAVLDNEPMRETVRDLLRAHLIERRTGVYVAGPRATDPVVTELLALYDADRMIVVAELSALAMDRIRSMASEAFANAFVLRKKRGDDDG